MQWEHVSLFGKNETVNDQREKNSDHDFSVRMWKYASLLGHSEGLYNLGLHYLDIDRNVAKECFRLAAERGHKMAAANLL